MRILAALAFGLLLSQPVGAIFLRPDLEKIPVERLAKNLEALVEKNPKDTAALYNLARLHAMAFALKTDTATIQKGKEAQGAWFDFTPLVPFKAVKTDDAAKQKAAAEQLNKALTRYDEVLKLEPKHLGANLGKAWLLDQSGKKDAAIKGYRELIELAWMREGKLMAGDLSPFVTTEAIGYLRPLLDKEKNKDELAALEQKTIHLAKLPRPITPIVVPLVDGATARDLEDRAARVTFDADGTGRKREWSWITPKGAWLVHDPKGQRNPTSALQLFGSVTFWLFWETGYDALASLDDNGDGEIAGRELDGLALWHDRNSDGVADSGEVKSLREHGIVALAFKYERDANHPDRIATSPRGVRFADGTARPTFDVILRSR